MKKIAVSILSLGLLVACNEATDTSAQSVAEAPAPKKEDVKTDLKRLESTPKEKLQVDSEVKPLIKEAGAVKQNFDIAITVPDSSWSMQVIDILENDDETAILVKLAKADGMAMQVISELQATVQFTSQKPTKVYVVGKSWGWENEEPYEFLQGDFDVKGQPILFKVTDLKSGAKKQMIEQEL